MDGVWDFENLWVAAAIERYLNGESDGAPLFRALYGATANEPVPERMLALLYGHRACAAAATEKERCGMQRGTTAALLKQPA